MIARFFALRVRVEYVNMASFHGINSTKSNQVSNEFEPVFSEMADIYRIWINQAQLGLPRSFRVILVSSSGKTLPTKEWTRDVT